MKNYLFPALAAIFLFTACTDADKDPLQFDKIQKGALLTLRGDALTFLQNPDNRGAINEFSISGNVDDYSLSFDADYQAEDPRSLSEVQVFASLSDNSSRFLIGTVQGAAFTLAAGDGTYPRGMIKIPLADILAKLGKSLGDFSENQYIFIECDLVLSDGSIVPASSISNLNLYQSTIFYPAHKLRMIAKS